MIFRIAALALGAWAGLVSGADAQEFLGAQTPTHNIHCQAAPPSQDQPTPELRCDIRNKTTRSPRPPRNCPLSWGDAFALDPTGPGRLLCHGDTVANPENPVVLYGTQWRAYGFTCTSQTSGMTCVNGEGHGFALSRASQKVF
jgi:hypothetical protein